MKIYFSTNEKRHSKLVRWIFNDSVSHMGLGFNVDGVEMVIDCAKPQGKLHHLKTWLDSNEVLFYLDIETSPTLEVELFKKAVRHNVSKPFDNKTYYRGLLYGLRKKLLGISLPTKNKSHSIGKNICSEIIKPLRKDLWELFDIDLSKYDFSCKTPLMVALILEAEAMECPFARWHHNAKNQKS